MAIDGPSASDIRAANRNAVGGGRKRCRKGKNCSATCIDAGKFCLVGLPEPASVSMSKASKMLQTRKSGNAPPAPTEAKKVAPATPQPKLTSGSEFPKVTGKRGYDPVKKFDSPDSKVMGKGGMGEVKETDGHPPGVVKKGSIGEYEAKALKVLEKTGVAPTLYGQKLIEKPGELEYGLGTHVKAATGYLGMSKVPGKPSESQMENLSYYRREDRSKMEDMANAYLSTRATIHREGVAHNDLHAGNFFYDPDSKKGYLIDFGLSQINPRAALMEGLGLGYKDPSASSRAWYEAPTAISTKGDWQGIAIRKKLEMDDTMPKNYRTYLENRQRVLTILRLRNPAALKEIQDGGIRMNNAALDKSGLTEQQAKDYINMLYEGID